MEENHVIKLASSNQREALEEAFCKLVDHEDEAIVVELSAETGEQTLLKLCDDLADDMRVMPRHTVQAVNSYSDCEAQLAYPDDVSFTEGQGRAGRSPGRQRGHR
jgi:hypothetical protein